MTYSLRVPDHNKGAEFVVKPSKGTLPPSMQQNINVSINIFYGMHLMCTYAKLHMIHVHVHVL